MRRLVTFGAIALSLAIIILGIGLGVLAFDEMGVAAMALGGIIVLLGALTLAAAVRAFQTL